MKVISTTIDYKGVTIKIENGKVYARAFGTTGPGQEPHYSWIELKVSNLISELRNLLKKEGLI